MINQRTTVGGAIDERRAWGIATGTGRGGVVDRDVAKHLKGI